MDTIQTILSSQRRLSDIEAVVGGLGPHECLALLEEAYPLAFVAEPAHALRLRRLVDLLVHRVAANVKRWRAMTASGSLVA